jgi:hypothetical protein
VYLCKNLYMSAWVSVYLCVCVCVHVVRGEKDVLVALGGMKFY